VVDDAVTGTAANPRADDPLSDAEILFKGRGHLTALLRQT
jgi:hypothetical protein